MSSGDRPAKKAKHLRREGREALENLQKPRGDVLEGAKKQLKTAARVAGIVLIVVWLLALAFWSGLKSNIPLYVAGVLTVAVAALAFVVRRNLGKSEELGQLVSDGSDLSPEQRAERMGKLDDRIAKGEAAAIIAKAQLQMQESPKDALTTLELVNLEKAQKPVAMQVRAMRTMIHLNLGDVAAARALADDVDLTKAPDLKLRANVAGVVAEAWARSGNPIEATQLLDKYDPNEKDFEDIKVQLLRARVFACVHGNDLKGMRKALKGLEEISPQLLGFFVGQKRIHPLLQQEAKKKLEKSGMIPKPRILARR